MEQRSKMASVSSSVEIDPMFIKALKLLHSKHPDSLDQLRALRDDVIRQHNQQVPTSSKVRVFVLLTMISLFGAVTLYCRSKTRNFICPFSVILTLNILLTL